MSVTKLTHITIQFMRNARLDCVEKTKKGAIDMKVPKCVNCGEPMISTANRDGLCIWICPHVKIHKLGHVTQAALYCSAQPKIVEVAAK